VKHYKDIVEKREAEKNRFSCRGAYCYLMNEKFVPNHLAAISAELKDFQSIKANKRTIKLEKINIQKNFSLLDMTREVFQQFVEENHLDNDPQL
jgi:hypothetical protein